LARCARAGCARDQRRRRRGPIAFAHCVAVESRQESICRNTSSRSQSSARRIVPSSRLKNNRRSRVNSTDTTPPTARPWLVFQMVLTVAAPRAGLREPCRDRDRAELLAPCTPLGSEMSEEVWTAKVAVVAARPQQASTWGSAAVYTRSAPTSAPSVARGQRTNAPHTRFGSGLRQGHPLDGPRVVAPHPLATPGTAPSSSPSGTSGALNPGSPSAVNSLGGRDRPGRDELPGRRD
jgi:hypothetical protein